MPGKDLQRVALVTGADRGLGQALTAGLLERGWCVFAGQYLPEWGELAALQARYPAMLHILPLDISSIESARAAAQEAGKYTAAIDLMINNAGVISPSKYRTIREAQDYTEMHRLYDVNALGPLRVVEAFLPLMECGSLKRLCFVSSEAGSIARSYRNAWYSYCMSKTALNMGVSILFNHLHPEGFTFRLYHPGWMRSYMGGTKNLEADLEPEQAAAYALPFFIEPRSDEDHLVLVDYQGREYPW
jgi:NAD(P)-dependent dehydrogenase (short-subunit alcohol dehydrogenase family)